MADLITLPRLKAALPNNVDPDAPSPQDGSMQAAIAAASSLIRNYTGLTFEVSDGAVATERSFEYDGSGFLDIDECTTITSVTTSSGYTSMPNTYTLGPDEWSAYPLNRPVKTWLRLPESTFGISPEMGFSYNLDTLAYKYPSRPSIVRATAVWGWPSIPEDVQQAAVWTALSIFETPKPYQSESIEGYSRTQGPQASNDPIPVRAQAILVAYIMPKV